MQEISLSSLALTALHVLTVAGVTLRVVLTRHPPGSSFAWIVLVATLPLAGVALYLLFGERPVGRWRERRMREFLAELPRWAARLPPVQPLAAAQPPGAIELAHLAERVTHMPLLAGTHLELLADTQAIMQRLIADIDAARESVDLEFYIWNLGGTADNVLVALEAAARRGLRCRLLLDAQGSKAFFRSAAPAALRAAGVHVVAALPVKLWQLPLVRADLRLHRKIAVVDARVAYTGSMNLVDPRYFKQDAGVGEWVDAMVRLEGPAVASLALVFAYDWLLQTGESLAPHAEVPAPANGGARVLVAPSGPGSEVIAYLRLIVEAFSLAGRRVLLTTRYFGAGEALALALQNAALRGVEVRLLVPERNDSKPVQYASRWHYDALLAAGVRILNYRGGLLHTKSITVDDALSLFGTVNLDVRSLNLNFELMLLILDADFTRKLVALQESYERDAVPVDPARWAQRGHGARLREGLANMISPVL
ncbi:MAG: cardiolipin synthase [Betaproteobacteria bacterium]